MNIVNKPLVSICMITYNHEKYISEAIEGIIMQKTTFPIELIIGEDCSTDSTREIVEAYAKQYPEIIIAQFPDKNRGVINNLVTVMQSAQGKYIALCEGDDYWTDPYKLQKQVDFLEKNEDFVLCAHDTRIRHDEDPTLNDTLFKDFPANAFCGRYKEVYTIEDVLLGNIFHLSSVLFRNISISYPKWFYEILTGDFLLVAFLAAHGRLYVSQDIMSTYRLNNTSITASPSSLLNSKIKSRYMHIKRDLLLNKYYERKYENILYEQIAKHHLIIMQEYKRQKKYFKSLFCLLKIRKYSNAIFLSQLRGQL